MEQLVLKESFRSDAHGNFQGDQCCFQFPSWAAKLKIVTSMLPRFVGHAARVHFLLGAPWSVPLRWDMPRRMSWGLEGQDIESDS